jgi:hypothetical protein
MHTARVASTWGRNGLCSSTPRRPTCLPTLDLLVLGSPSRRAPRAGRRSAHRRHDLLAGPTEPRARQPARLGQPLRRLKPRANRRRSLAGATNRARLLGGRGEPRFYAVDVSVWGRCDAEASPGRDYYHPSRHSAGQPIAARSGPTSRSPGSPSNATRGCRPWARGASARRKRVTTWQWLRLRTCCAGIFLRGGPAVRVRCRIRPRRSAAMTSRRNSPRGSAKAPSCSGRREP